MRKIPILSVAIAGIFLLSVLLVACSETGVTPPSISEGSCSPQSYLLESSDYLFIPNSSVLHFDLFGEIYQEIRSQYIAVDDYSEKVDGRNLVYAAAESVETAFPDWAKEKLVSFDPNSAPPDINSYFTNDTDANYPLKAFAEYLINAAGPVFQVTSGETQAAFEGILYAIAGMLESLEDPYWDLVIDEGSAGNDAQPSDIAVMLPLRVEDPRRHSDAFPAVATTTIRTEIVANTSFGAQNDLSIGYIRLSEEFSEDLFGYLYTTLNQEGFKDAPALILDLRGNPGGGLNSAVHISDLFLGSGEITTLAFRNRAERYFASTEKEFSQPVVLLVDGYTASAAELVAAALQSRERASLVGGTTYGKGVGQTVYGFDVPYENIAMQFTTLLWCAPGGKSVHEVGIEPDVLLYEAQDTINFYALAKASTTEFLNSASATVVSDIQQFIPSYNTGNTIPEAFANTYSAGADIPDSDVGNFIAYIAHQFGKGTADLFAQELWLAVYKREGRDLQMSDLLRHDEALREAVSILTGGN